MKLKDYYPKKKEFISDFLKLCRYNRNNGVTYGSYKTGINDELWSFNVFTSYCGVSTECFYNGKLLGHITENLTVYPRTTWGEPGVRWDSDLKKFLEREICKQ